MKIANNNKELIEAVLAGEECRLVENTGYHGLYELTHLKGVCGAPGAVLGNLNSIKTLAGFVGAERMGLHVLSSLTTLEGFEGSERMGLHGLSSIKTLDGFVGAKYMELRGLTSIETLDGFIGSEHMGLIGLTSLETLGDYKPELNITLLNLKVLEINPRYITDKEVDILSQIPLDKLGMENWHSNCGTVHCLAGWGQVLTVPEDERAHTELDGFNALPSMSPYFYYRNGEDKIKDYVLSLR